jgi:hypothetical protein
MHLLLTLFDLLLNSIPLPVSLQLPLYPDLLLHFYLLESSLFLLVLPLFLLDLGLKLLGVLLLLGETRLLGLLSLVRAVRTAGGAACGVV